MTYPPERKETEANHAAFSKPDSPLKFVARTPSILMGITNTIPDTRSTLLHPPGLLPHPPPRQRRPPLRLLRRPLWLHRPASPTRLHQLHPTRIRWRCPAQDDARPQALGLRLAIRLLRRPPVCWIHAPRPSFPVWRTRTRCGHDEWVGVCQQEDICGEEARGGGLDRRAQMVSGAGHHRR